MKQLKPTSGSKVTVCKNYQSMPSAKNADIRTKYDESEQLPPLKFTAESHVVTMDKISCKMPCIPITDMAIKKENTFINMPEEEILDGKFIEKETGVDVIKIGDKFNKTIRLSNFKVEILSMKKHIFLSKEELFYEIKIFNKNVSEIVEIARELYFNIYNEIAKIHPEFRLYSDSYKSAGLFREYLSAVYQRKKNFLKINNFYEYSGWINDDSSVRYISGSDENCNSKRKIAYLKNINLQNIFASAWRILSLSADKHVVLPLFLQMHIGYTAKLFEDAGLPVQYVFNIIGATGSKKTAVAKILYCLFDMTDGINFTATDRAIEIYAEKCHDATVLLDDLYSVKEKSVLDKMHRFLRIYADGIGRVRSINAGKDIERTDTRYAVIVTAESMLDGLQQSAKLRNLVVHVRKDTFNNDVLRQFQIEAKEATFEGSSNSLEIYLSAYIRFLESNYTQIVKDMINFQPPEMNLKFARHNTIYKILSFQAKLILDFGRTCGFFTDIDVSNLWSEWISILQNVMLENQYLCNQEEPYRLFLEAVMQSYAQKIIQICNSKSEYELTAKFSYGYIEQNILKFEPDKIFEYVMTYYSHIGRGFSATLNDIISILYEKGVVDAYEQKNHKAKMLKSVVLNGIKTKFLCLKMDKIKQILESEGDC